MFFPFASGDYSTSNTRRDKMPEKTPTTRRQNVNKTSTKRRPSDKTPNKRRQDVSNTPDYGFRVHGHSRMPSLMPPFSPISKPGQLYTEHTLKTSTARQQNVKKTSKKRGQNVANKTSTNRLRNVNKTLNIKRGKKRLGQYRKIQSGGFRA